MTVKQFIYRTHPPHARTGRITASNMAQAMLIATKQGINIAKIRPKNRWRRSQQKLSTKQLYQFTQAITVLIQTGIPIADSLALLMKQSQHPKQKQLLHQLYQQLTEGQTLTTACEYCQLPLLYCRLIDVGEQATALPQIFQQLAEYYRRRIQLTKMCTKALMYPSCVLTVATGVTTVLLIFVIPKLQQMFSSFDQALPAFTQLVLSLSDLCRTHGLALLVTVLFSAIALFQFFKRNRHAKRLYERTILKSPIVGRFCQLSNQAAICQTLSTTLKAGIAADQSLLLCYKLCRNSLYQSALKQVLQAVTAGQTLHQALKKTTRFPPEMILLTAVGENTAQLPATFAHLANQYQQQLDHLLANLGGLLEPLLMVIMGGLVGGLVIAMYLPIFQMGSTLG